jgi:hypothetical protein
LRLTSSITEKYRDILLYETERGKGTYKQDLYICFECTETKEEYNTQKETWFWWGDKKIQSTPTDSHKSRQYNEKYLDSHP